VYVGEENLLEQVDTFLYLGSLIIEDGECTTEFRTRLNRGQAIGASLQKMWKSHSIPISTKIRLMKALVWPVATYGCESWTLKKNEETRLYAYEMKGLRDSVCFVDYHYHYYYHYHPLPLPTTTTTTTTTTTH